MNIGHTIKMFRTGLKIKQQDFAMTVGVSANYIYLVENGKREPSLSFLRSVAKALGVPITFLFVDEEIKPKIGRESEEIYEKLKALILQVQQIACKNNKGTPRS